MLRGWQEQEDQIIVCLDANKNIYQKQLGLSFTAQDGLRMYKVVGCYMGKPLGVTYFHALILLMVYGQHQIYRLSMPALCHVVNFLILLLMGKESMKIL